MTGVDIMTEAYAQCIVCVIPLYKPIIGQTRNKELRCDKVFWSATTVRFNTPYPQP